MFMGSVIEDSFNIAWGFLEKSGQIRDAETSTNYLVRFIERQIVRRTAPFDDRQSRDQRLSIAGSG
jgi:hypothetical protein